VPYIIPAMPSILDVRRGAFIIEDPWNVPDGVDVQPLVRATDGGAPRLATHVAAYRDDGCLTILFSGRDDGVVASLFDHDQPLYQEDVFEAFLAPLSPAHYFEIEVNPLGTVLDVRIDSPDGERRSMRSSFEWNCPDLFAAVRRTAHSFEAVLRFPFASLQCAPPVGGSEWRANFFRIDRSAAAGDEYLAWSPTMRTPPDFHVTAAFGVLRFV
jgi:alpha-galactosidase